MKKFNTTPEERLRQLEKRALSEVEDRDVMLRMILDEIHCLKVSMGLRKPDEWFALLTEVNDNSIKKNYNEW